MLINDLTIEDVLMLTSTFFSLVLGFALGFTMGRK